MRRQAGMALLMTLTILVVLSLALAKSFEDRALERRHLQAEEARFQIENLSRSVLRGLIQAMRQIGYWQVAVSPMGIGRIPPGAVVPLGEGGVSNLRITPLDDRFNLRSIYAPQNGPAKLFEATLTQIYANREVAGYPPNAEEVMSAINDFQDADSDPDANFPYGAEQYPGVRPRFKVKNAPFDRLGEVKVLPAWQRLGLSQKELETHFRVAGDLESGLDVNSASKEQIEAFLERFAEIGEPYPNLARLQDELVEILSQKDEMGLEPYFDHPFVKRGNSVFEQELKSRGLEGQLNSSELALFRGVPGLVEVSYTVHHGEFSRRVRALLELKFGRSSRGLGGAGGKLPSLSEVVIERFEIR